MKSKSKIIKIFLLLTILIITIIGILLFRTELLNKETDYKEIITNENSELLKIVQQLRIGMKKNDVEKTIGKNMKHFVIYWNKNNTLEGFVIYFPSSVDLYSILNKSSNFNYTSFNKKLKKEYPNITITLEQTVTIEDPEKGYSWEVNFLYERFGRLSKFEPWEEKLKKEPLINIIESEKKLYNDNYKY